MKKETSSILKLIKLCSTQESRTEESRNKIFESPEQCKNNNKMKYTLQNLWYKTEHYFSDIKYKISIRLWPCQEWLTSKLNNSGGWMDKDYLLEIAVFECFKHYVEKEKPYELTAPKLTAFAKDMHKTYEKLTKILPGLERDLSELESSLTPLPMIDNIWPKQNLKDKQTLKKIWALEEKIYNLKTEIMVWVCANRNHLWT